MDKNSILGQMRRNIAENHSKNQTGEFLQISETLKRKEQRTKKENANDNNSLPQKTGEDSPNRA
jgi:hypothetical protein